MLVSFYRPIELSEKFAVQRPLGGDSNKMALLLYDGKSDHFKTRYDANKFSFLRQTNSSHFDPLLMGYLCYETVIQHGKNVLIFASTKAQCVRHAKKVANVLQALQRQFPSSNKKTEKNGKSLTSNTNRSDTNMGSVDTNGAISSTHLRRLELLDNLKRVATVVEPILKVRYIRKEQSKGGIKNESTMRTLDTNRSLLFLLPYLLVISRSFLKGWAIITVA